MHSCSLEAKIKLNLGVFLSVPYLIWLKIPQRKRRWFCVFFFSCCRGPGCGEGHRCEEEASRKVIYSSILDCQNTWMCKEMLMIWFVIWYRKNATTTEPKPKKSRRLRKVKDPNMPKRPPTAFFLFMWASVFVVLVVSLLINMVYFVLIHILCFRDDFRKEYKESNPDSKNVSVVWIRPLTWFLRKLVWKLIIFVQ